MKLDEIVAMQVTVGTVPDGFWGPKSIAACQKYLRGLMPTNNPWPEADPKSLRAFYGEPGESRLVSIRFPYPMFYQGKIVTTTRCHELVADPLLRVLKDIGNRWGGKRGIMEEAEDYGGCYNYRPMRNGALLSTHAWGIAIDLDADDNGNLVPWPAVADMPLEIMAAFAREGALAAGAFWGRDAMHMQFTR